MTNFKDRFIREPLRKILMRVLISTEKKSEKTVLTRQDSILQKDIHIPPFLVAILSSSFLLIVFLFQMGWSANSFISLSIFVLLTLSLFIFYLKRDLPKLAQDDEAIMLLGTLLILFVLIIGVLRRWPVSFYLTPIPTACILTTLLLHPRLSIIVAIVLAMILAMMHNFSFDCFILGFFSALAGTASAFYIHTHRDFIRAGAAVAVIGFLTLTILTVFHQDSFTHFFWGTLWTVSNGFISSMLALGLLPFLESFFQRITPMKLLELANFNQPLLKRLMLEAPGTYHHSLMLATIAESAANEIGANALLCRVGAYYHDIGKLVKPEYFIENQGSMGYNPHRELAPALSTLIVIQHIKEGIALARAAKLPQEIINFIPMHHGTSRIEYFYHQAKEDAEQETLKNIGTGGPETEVEEENYRYPGPKPETKETAILMLTDSIEAATKTLEDPTHLRIKDLTANIIQQKLKDGQLSNSPLTLADLNKIKESFVKTLTSIYHSRVEYPEEDESR